jgi:flagellar biosynthesis protein FliR
VNAGIAIYFALILARVAAFVAVMPLFVSRTPRSVRAGLALVLAIFYFGTIMPSWDAQFARHYSEYSSFQYALALFREAFLGIVVGFAFNLFILPVRIAGEFITQQIGLSITPQQGLGVEGSAGSLTLLLEAMAGIIFLELNGHHVVFVTLHSTFDLYPLGGSLFPNPTKAAVDGLQATYTYGALLAAPLGLCMFLTTTLLAILSRAAPQLNIFNVGFTIQVLVALFGSLFLLPDFIRILIGIIGHQVEAIPTYLR